MNLFQFFRCYADAPAIMRADKSALGTMPAAALQYCEAMRVASAFGWYVFPPKDIHLLFDGKEVFFYEADHWFPVKSTTFEDSFLQAWSEMAPPDLAEMAPPFLTELFVPGILQIWSGYFITTAPGWSTLIRPVANYDVRSSFSCFEGLVETDVFNPMPLFVNVRLTAAEREIYIPASKPLFQIQPVERKSYSAVLSDAKILDMTPQDTKGFPWDRYLSTVRDETAKTAQSPGRYAVTTRKRSAT